MVGVTPSLLTSLPGHCSSERAPTSPSSHPSQVLKGTLYHSLPLSTPSLRGAANLTGKHLTTIGPHLPGAGFAGSRVLLVSGSASGPLSRPLSLLQGILLVPVCLFMGGKTRPTSPGAQGPAVIFSGCKLAMLNLAHSRKPSTNKVDTLMGVLSYLS